MITIDARPESMTIDPSRTAVIVVDMENDFGAEGGMFARAGIDISPIRGVLGPTRKVLAAARRNGVKVVYLKMAFQADLSDAGLPDSPIWLKHAPFGVGDTVMAPDGSESRILIRDTWNTDILDELKPEEDDIVVYKHRFSGFYETDLDAVLRRLGIQSLIFTGCTTSVCVESTLATRCSATTTAFSLRTARPSPSGMTCRAPTTTRRSWSSRFFSVGRRGPTLC